MSSNNSQKQVSLAGAAMGGAHGGKGGRSRARRPGGKKRRWLLWGGIAVLAVAAIVGVQLYRNRDKGPTLAARDFIEYTYTPDDRCGDVSYYALGISGENAGDALDMTALLCVNRKEHSTALLQLPTATYIGDGETFAAQTVGAVWGNPKALTWCPTCRGRVAADAVEDGKHTVCGTAVETRMGSAATNYAQFFNTQLGLPVDNYLVIPREGLAKLIDAVGGVTLNVAGKFRCGETDYEAGVQALPGEAAVYYITQYNYNGTPASDIERMARQRELLAALVSRLSQYKQAELFNTDPRKADVLSDVMAGAAPIRMDTSDFGKARLMGKGHDAAASDTKYNAALAEFVHTVCAIPLENMQCAVLPGETAKKGAATVWSAHREQTLSLLREQMDPAGLLQEDAFGISELSSKGKFDSSVVTLASVLTPQPEKAELQTAATTTTTAAQTEAS